MEYANGRQRAFGRTGGSVVDLVGKGRRVRIYVNENQRVGWKPTHLALLEFLRRENALGATVLRGVEGFGATGELHVSHLVTDGTRHRRVMISATAGNGVRGSKVTGPGVITSAAV